MVGAGGALDSGSRWKAALSPQRAAVPASLQTTLSEAGACRPLGLLSWSVSPGFVSPAHAAPCRLAALKGWAGQWAARGALPGPAGPGPGGGAQPGGGGAGPRPRSTVLTARAFRCRHLDGVPPDREHHRLGRAGERQDHQAVEERLLGPREGPPGRPPGGRGGASGGFPGPAPGDRAAPLKGACSRQEVLEGDISCQFLSHCLGKEFLVCIMFSQHEI